MTINPETQQLGFTEFISARGLSLSPGRKQGEGLREGIWTINFKRLYQAQQKFKSQQSHTILLIMSDQTCQLADMQICSPFMSCISECRARMKKLRKKIYKNLKSKHNQQTPSKNKIKSFKVNSILSQCRLPSFLTLQSATVSRDTGLRDITNLNAASKVDYLGIRAYADQQERQVEEIIRKMTEQKISSSSLDFISDEEESSLNRLKSRTWLQSTEMEYSDSSLMERESRISLKPFELFPQEDQPLQSQNNDSYNHLREANGFLTLESDQLFEQAMFMF